MKPIRYVYEARDELRNARKHYNLAKPGLGDDFVEQVLNGIAEVRRSPESFSRYRRTQVRICLIRRFPYALYFLPIGEDIVVLAIAHHHRRPGYWRSRVPTS